MFRPFPQQDAAVDVPCERYKPTVIASLAALWQLKKSKSKK